MYPNDTNRRRALAAGGLANQLAANPLSQQVAQSPLRQAMQQRRTQSIAGLQGAQRDMAGPMTSGPIGTVDPGQRNQAMRFTLQPQMNGGDAIDAAYARRAAASAAKPTARIGLGSDGQRMVAQGTPLSRMFPSASDEGNRAKFEAARDARAERKAEARAMRQDQLAQQRQATMSQQGQTQVINPFMNPIAMEAMRRQPELALGAVNSLNEAIQGRGRLQTAQAATVADQQYRQQDLGLRGALGMGRLDLDRQGMESENKYRGSQADAAMRTADANYMSAEAQAARAQAEADAISDPANRQFQNQMDLFTAASGIPGMEREVRDLFGALNGGQSTGTGPASGAPQFAPLPFTVEPDPATGDIAPEQMDALIGELANGQQLQGQDLLSALQQQGVTRNQAEQYFIDNAPGRMSQGFDRIRGWLGGAATDRGLDRKYRPFTSLAGALNIDY